MAKKIDFMARVDKCSDNFYWYADKIGEYFPIQYFGATETYVRTLDSYNTGNYIQNDDYTVFEAEETSK
jgi:hypothetical protein